MADIKNVDGEETDITANEDALKSAQMKAEFSPPVMWAEGGDGAGGGGDVNGEPTQSLAHRLLDRLG